VVTIAEWADWAESLAQRMRSHFATEDELRATLTDAISHPTSPITRAMISIEARGKPVLAVDVGVGDAAGLETVTRLHDGEDDTVTVSAVPRLAVSSISMEGQQQISATLVGLANAFWNGHFRDSQAALPWRNAPGSLKMIEASISGLLGSHGYLCSMFVDIDGFHEINRQVGQQHGDLLIGHVGRTIASVAGPSALAIRRGGDEFIVLVGVDRPEDALRGARRLMEGVANTPSDNRTLGVSVGLALVPAKEPPESIDELDKAAEEALMQDGEKRRGTARLAPSREQPVPPQTLDLWLCQVTAGASCRHPFGNAWLNLLSEDVAGALCQSTGTESVAGVVQRFLDWAVPTWADGLGAGGDGCEPKFSPMEVALATAHGVLRGGLCAPSGSDARIWLAHSAAMDSVELRRTDGGDPLVALGPPLQDGLVELPVVDHLYAPTVPGAGQIDCRRGVLLVVGRDPLPVPAQLFREVIRVDDRPTRQGGLPDFWAAALAQLVGRCEQSPNVTSVFVLGQRTNARETTRWIEDRDKWSDQAERLTRKTGVAARALQAAAQQLTEVIYCGSGEELLAALHKVQRAGGAFAAEPNQAARPLPRILHREVRPELFRLPETAGCRVDRVADAYPVVLDRLRSADRSAHRIRDEAGHDLIEFRDFMVRVDDLEAEKVPQAYLDDSGDLESYYHAQFIEPGGTFTAALEAQAQVVIAGLRSSLERAPTATTRRAVLVVPHDVSAGEMNPLGLIAVRVAPRVSGAATRLDFSFVWRTVEAVVGLPYSLYGSARYAEELRDRLAAILPGSVTPGSLTYIAMSLHMGIDDYSQQVARRVVEDASD